MNRSIPLPMEQIEEETQAMSRVTHLERLLDRDRNPDYNPVRLFNVLFRRFKLRSDADLAALLGCSPANLHRIRYKKPGYPFGPFYILRTHDLTGMPVKEIIVLLIGEKEKPAPKPVTVRWRDDDD